MAYISRFNDCTLYLEDYLMYEHSTTHATALLPVGCSKHLSVYLRGSILSGSLSRYTLSKLWKYSHYWDDIESLIQRIYSFLHIQCFTFHEGKHTASQQTAKSISDQITSTINSLVLTAFQMVSINLNIIRSSAEIPQVSFSQNKRNNVLFCYMILILWKMYVHRKKKFNEEQKR